MKILISLLVILIAFFVSIFCLSNILLTFFYTIPRLIKEKQQGNLLKKIPILKILWGPVIFSLILGIGVYFSIRLMPNYLTEIFIGFIVALILLIIGKKNKDMDEDFRRYFKDYFRFKDSHEVTSKIIDHHEIRSMSLRAFKKYALKDYKCAIAIYDKLIEIDPRNVDDLTMRAQALEILNFNLDAIDDYELALSIDDSDGNAFGLLGLGYFKIGQLEMSLKNLDIAVKKGWNMYKVNLIAVKTALSIGEVGQDLINRGTKIENLQRRSKENFIDDLSEIDEGKFKEYIFQSINHIQDIMKMNPDNKELQSKIEFLYSKLN